MLSRQLATLDVLSGGRITAGIGLGGSAEEFRRMRGDLPSPNRGKMMDEFVPALRVLWEESKATYSGQYVNFQDIEAYPKPVQSPLPIFMAGQADGVLRRLARYGQGWIDTTLLPDAIKEIAGQISFYPAQAGRDGSDIEITRQFYISLATSKEEAEANLAASLPGAKQAAAAQPARPIEMTLVGTPAESAPRLRAYMGTGVTEICAIFYSPTVESALRQMELFVRDVIPRVARLREVVAACGLELTCGLAVADDSYDEQIVAGFSLPVGERLARVHRT